MHTLTMVKWFIDTGTPPVMGKTEHLGTPPSPKETVEDPERGGQGATPPNLRPSEEKLWELPSSWLSVSTLAMIKFVVHSLPGKIMFSTLFYTDYRNSSAFDWATVSLECQTGQVYWRSGWAGECTKIRILTPKIKKKQLWGDCQLYLDEWLL